MARDPKFYNDLKELNEDFFKFIEAAHKKSPYYDLTPTLNDYIKQFNEIDEKYPEKTNSITSNSNVGLFSSTTPAINFKFTPSATATSLPPAPSISNTNTAVSSGLNPQAPSFIPASSANQPAFSSLFSANFTSSATANAVPRLNFSSAPSSGPAPMRFSSSSGTTATSLASQVPNFSSPPTTNTAPFTPLFSAGSTNPSAASSNIKISSSASVSATPPAANLFGSSLTSATTAAPTQAPKSFFSFTMPNKDATTATTIPASNFSFGSNPSFGNTTINNDPNASVLEGDNSADEDSGPPESNVDKYDEPDAKFRIRGKIFEINKAEGSGGAKLLGIGEFFVKTLEAAGKFQLIFRQDPDLRKVLLNEVLTAQMPVKQAKNTIHMFIPTSEGVTKVYILRVKEEKDAQEVFSLLDSLKR